MSVTASSGKFGISERAARFLAWSKAVDLSSKLSIALVVAAIVSGSVTYAALSGGIAELPSTEVIFTLLLVNMVFLLSLGALITRRLVAIWVARRRGSAGSRLHIRLVALFSLVAVTPTIIIGAFSVMFFNLGLQAWFSERVRATVQESVAIADAYVEEHRKVISADLLAMANDINRQSSQLISDQPRFHKMISTQAALRSLTDAVVVTSTGKVLARTRFSFSFGLDRIPAQAIEMAGNGEVVVLADSDEDRVSALMRLDRFLDAYLYVSRFLDSKVLSHVSRAKRAAMEYEKLEQERAQIEITFAAVFILVALLLLLAAAWFGLAMATRLIRPITRLIEASELVRDGDLSVHIEEGGPDDEIGTLNRAFNRMTGQLAGQRNELVEANRQLDQRRRFTETILSGISAGVLAVDASGKITLSNRSAINQLHQNRSELVGHNLAQAVPEMAPLLDEMRSRHGRPVDGQITIVRDGETRTFLVQISSERSGENISGYIVTFDNITQLVTAQRMAAWADVARRIAHEIKNPLTPIQLSAERLRRKYQDQINVDPETFAQCTDTIIRQVGDIGRMVDEFSSFARMPEPVREKVDLGPMIEQEIALQKTAYPAIGFETTINAGPTSMICDRGQISQVLTNIIKNAVESIEARVAQESGSTAEKHGHIAVSLTGGGTGADDDIVIEVKDDGIGLPKDERARLTEPYVTTRVKGTGLGLAIVQKIMEDHGGTLTLADRSGGGACIRLIFPQAPDNISADNISGSNVSTVSDVNPDTGEINIMTSS